jgi:hypothetical protein
MSAQQGWLGYAYRDAEFHAAGKPLIKAWDQNFQRKGGETARVVRISERPS